MFLLLPVFALLLKAAFRQRLYFDHLIYSLHVHSAAYVILAVLLPLESAANQHWLPFVIQVAALCYMLSYFVISIRRVYRTETGRAVRLTLGILVLYIALLGIAVDVAR